MNISDMDIKTIISLLFVGDLALLVVLIFYRNIREYRRPYWHFMAGKMLQSLAWLLLSVRGTIPDFLSVYIGNTLLISGFALEVFSLTTVGRPEKSWGIVYFSIATIGIAVFCIFASRPNLWIGYATTASIALFLPASVSMFFAHTSSLIRKIVGLFYGVVCVTIAFRAWNGFFAANEFVLMSRNLIQTLSFTTMFLLLIVGGSGFLLLFKEQADKLMSESEEKYRTLVEKANESICIIQDRKVVFANGTASELLGVSQDNLIGRPFTDFIFPDDMEIVMSYYVGRSEKREIPDSYNFRVMNQKGEPIWVLNSATLIEYGGKQAVIALITNINKLKLMEKERERMIEELKKALATVKTLSGLLPICASCKKIRDDKGYWNQIESYISDHSEAKFSHAICPECSEKLYPELYKKK